MATCQRPRFVTGGGRHRWLDWPTQHFTHDPCSLSHSHACWLDGIYVMLVMLALRPWLSSATHARTACASCYVGCPRAVARPLPALKQLERLSAWAAGLDRRPLLLS